MLAFWNLRRIRLIIGISWIDLICFQSRIVEYVKIIFRPYLIHPTPGLWAPYSLGLILAFWGFLNSAFLFMVSPIQLPAYFRFCNRRYWRSLCFWDDSVASQLESYAFSSHLLIHSHHQNLQVLAFYGLMWIFSCEPCQLNSLFW